VKEGKAEERHLRVEQVREQPSPVGALWGGASSFDRPVLVVWASEDRIMSPEHSRWLADLLPNTRLVEIAGSHTLIPEDSPLSSPRTCAPSSATRLR
jgi:pimeloyl-ACP methyl ester carboxylesterase